MDGPSELPIQHLMRSDTLLPHGDARSARTFSGKRMDSPACSHKHTSLRNSIGEHGGAPYILILLRRLSNGNLQKNRVNVGHQLGELGAARIEPPLSKLRAPHRESEAATQLEPRFR